MFRLVTLSRESRAGEQVIMYITPEEQAPEIKDKFREYAMKHADLTFKYGGVFHWAKAMPALAVERKSVPGCCPQHDAAVACGRTSKSGMVQPAQDWSECRRCRLPLSLSLAATLRFAEGGLSCLHHMHTHTVMCGRQGALQ